MATTPQKQQNEGPHGPNLSELVDAIMGWNHRSIRTLRDSLIDPVSVCRHALDSDTSRYVSPVRLLIFLISAMIAITAFLLGGQSQRLEVNLPNIPIETLEAYLADKGTTLEDLNDTVSFWSNIFTWPVMLISSSPYILLFKAFHQRRTLYGHALVYCVTTNGAMAVQLSINILMSFWIDIHQNMALSVIVLLIVYFYISARVIFALYSQTLLGGSIKFLILFFVTPIITVFSGLLYFFMSALVMDMSYGVSMFELVAIQQEHSQ